MRHPLYSVRHSALPINLTTVLYFSVTATLVYNTQYLSWHQNRVRLFILDADLNFPVFRLVSLHAKLSNILMPVQPVHTFQFEKRGMTWNVSCPAPASKALSKSSNTDELLIKTRIPSDILSNVWQHTSKILTNIQCSQLSPWLEYHLVGSVLHFFSVSKFLDWAVFPRDTFNQSTHTRFVSSRQCAVAPVEWHASLPFWEGVKLGYLIHCSKQLAKQHDVLSSGVSLQVSVRGG
jgi:hypothetical protein